MQSLGGSLIEMHDGRFSLDDVQRLDSGKLYKLIFEIIDSNAPEDDDKDDNKEEERDLKDKEFFQIKKKDYVRTK